MQDEMQSSHQFLLPSPDFGKKDKAPKPLPYFLTPSGMTLLPREKQPPPMYGPRGPTFPAKLLAQRNEKDKPQERYFCEPCDMEFQSSNDFRRHRFEHERCPVDGCKFKAHNSVMDKHVTELHNSGIFEKIKKISTPEEIAAWREERRKKYPTLANAQMRQLAQEQRQRRGERLEGNKSRFGRPEDRKRARNVEKSFPQKEVSVRQNQQERNKRGRDNRKQRRDQADETKKPLSQPSIVVEKLNGNEEMNDCGVRPFEGTSKMEDYQHQKIKKRQTANVLSSLVGMYGSDEDDSDSELEMDSSDETVQQPATGKPIDVCNDSTDTVVQEKAVECAESKSSVVEKPQTPIQEDSAHSNESKKEAIFADKSDADAATKVITLPTDTSKSSASTLDINNEDKLSHDSSDEAPDEVPTERSNTSIPDLSNSLSTTNIISDATTSSATKDKRKHTAQKRKYGLDYRRVKLRKQNTMLEKLLEPDIRHERNVLLQCVRFVCENNFFGIGSKSEQEKMS